LLVFHHFPLELCKQTFSSHRKVMGNNHLIENYRHLE
jgi:hypothetical protein